MIVLELFQKFLVPVRIEDPLENIEEDDPLVLGVEVAGQERFGDMPEIRYMAAQQTTLGMFVIPGKTDGLLLRFGERVVQRFHGGFGRALGAGRCAGFCERVQSADGCRRCGSCDRLEKTSAIEIIAIRDRNVEVFGEVVLHGFFLG